MEFLLTETEWTPSWNLRDGATTWTPSRPLSRVSLLEGDYSPHQFSTISNFFDQVVVVGSSSHSEPEFLWIWLEKDKTIIPSLIVIFPILLLELVNQSFSGFIVISSLFFHDQMKFPEPGSVLHSNEWFHEFSFKSLSCMGRDLVSGVVNNDQAMVCMMNPWYPSKWCVTSRCCL